MSLILYNKNILSFLYIFIIHYYSNNNNNKINNEIILYYKLNQVCKYFKYLFVKKIITNFFIIKITNIIKNIY